MQNFSSKVKNELLRALRSFRYERTDNGDIFIPRANALFGGVFGARVDDGPLVYGHNTLANEMLNAMLDAYLSQGAQPVGLYLAPFTNNISPTAALTAATFAATQGEYAGYAETARPQWVSNGAAASQTKSNSVAPGVVTIGTGGATIYGAGLLTVSTKSATTGTLVAAGLFGTANTLNANSKLTMEYTLTATAV